MGRFRPTTPSILGRSLANLAEAPILITLWAFNAGLLPNTRTTPPLGRPCATVYCTELGGCVCGTRWAGRVSGGSPVEAANYRDRLWPGQKFDPLEFHSSSDLGGIPLFRRRFACRGGLLQGRGQKSRRMGCQSWSSRRGIKSGPVLTTHPVVSKQEILDLRCSGPCSGRLWPNN